MAKPTYSRTCCGDFTPSVKRVLNESGIIKSYSKNSDIYLPCEYNDIDEELDRMPVVENSKYGVIDNIDSFVSKSELYNNLRSSYALRYLPKSWVIRTDMKNFINYYNKHGGYYIIKKNLQQQNNIVISNNLDTIKWTAQNSEYVIIQSLLTRPYKINNRKIDMRFYLFIVITESRKNLYVFNDGFIYYPREETNEENVEGYVSSGYVDRSIYKTNPLTHKDLYSYLDNPRRQLSKSERDIMRYSNISNVLRNNAHECIKSVMKPFMEIIGNSIKTKYTKNNTLFQHFGADIAVGDNFNCKLLEINKGPDLNYKDERDKNVKLEFVRNMYGILGYNEHYKDMKKLI